MATANITPLEMRSLLIFISLLASVMTCMEVLWYNFDAYSTDRMNAVAAAIGRIACSTTIIFLVTLRYKD